MLFDSFYTNGKFIVWINLSAIDKTHCRPEWLFGHGVGTDIHPICPILLQRSLNMPEHGPPITFSPELGNDV